MDEDRDGSGRAGGERGVALVVAILMMVVLTVLGLASLRTATLDMRAAGTYGEFIRQFFVFEGRAEELRWDYAKFSNIGTFTDAGTKTNTEDKGAAGGRYAYRASYMGRRSGVPVGSAMSADYFDSLVWSVAVTAYTDADTLAGAGYTAPMRTFEEALLVIVPSREAANK